MKVLIGKDDWLFLQNDTNRIVEQNNGTLKMAENSLKIWLRTLETRFAILKNRGIRYYFLIAPNKETIYPEYLPDDYRISGDRIVYQLINACKPYTVPVYYPVDILNEYKLKYQLYPLGDTHWNGIGGFIAYEYIMNIIKKDVKTNILAWEDLYFMEKEIFLDLGGKLNPPRGSVFSWGIVKQPRGQFIYDNQAVNSGHVRITLNEDPNLPTAVIFHDSFMQVAMPYFMESFSKIHFVHTARLDYDLIEKIHPDVVISEMVERFLLQPPVDL